MKELKIGNRVVCHMTKDSYKSGVYDSGELYIEREDTNTDENGNRNCWVLRHKNWPDKDFVSVPKNWCRSVHFERELQELAEAKHPTLMTQTEQAAKKAAGRFIMDLPYEGGWTSDQLEAAFLAGVQYAHQWIKVTPETMPKAGKLVQLVYHGTVQHMPYIWDGNAFQDLNDADENTIFADQVSHWRYLDTTPPTEK
jgi:hypothetical protein